MLLAKGTLKYFPIEGEENNRGWLILQCDRDISLYYSWFIQKKLGIRLQQSMHGSHISIVRGEVIHSLQRWNAYQAYTLEFNYFHQIETNGKHWWLNVYSPCFIVLRQELGLDPQPVYDFHLTIGVLVLGS